jgi:hypothetical protein
MRMRGVISVLCVSGLALGCAAHEENKPKDPVEVATTPEPDTKPEPEPEPEPKVVDQVSIAVSSLQLQEDCEPQAPPAPAPTLSRTPSPTKSMGATAKRRPSADESLGDVAYDPMRASRARRRCQQSTMQLAVTSKATKDAPFVVKGVRLRQAGKDKVLQEMTVRNPTVWKDSGYTTWDQIVGAEAALKVGYDIAGPDWSTVEKALGSSSYGPLFEVEVVVEIDGEEKTLEASSSPRAPRDEPEPNIVT